MNYSAHFFFIGPGTPAFDLALQKGIATLGLTFSVCTVFLRCDFIGAVVLRVVAFAFAFEGALKKQFGVAREFFFAGGFDFAFGGAFDVPFGRDTDVCRVSGSGIKR